MGGTTITRYGKTVDEVLTQLKEQVLAGREAGLYPDSEAVIISGDDFAGHEVKKKTARLYKFSDEGDYEEVTEGRIFHVGTAAMYSKPPEPGQFLGTIHLHT